MDERTPESARIRQVSLLADDVRRRVYEAVSAAAAPVDRDAVAEAAGISRSLAAFHLDRLVEGGLLESSFRRRAGRSGPGAGRPAKFYRRTDDAISVSLPERRYEVAAEVFAAALETSGRSDEAVLRAASEAGHVAARAVPRARRSAKSSGRAALTEVLGTRGFEPRAVGDGGIELGNCPFKALTAEHRELTCGANLALLSALVDDFPGAGLAAERLEPPAPCCVTLRPRTDVGTYRAEIETGSEPIP